MDDWVTRIYVNEVLSQAEAAEIAAADLQTAVRAVDFARAFAAVQSLLGAGAMISKLLWPNPARARPNGEPLNQAEEALRQATLLRGRTLRSVLKAKDLPILENRKVRNAFEHFDDRLDAHFQTGSRVVIDRGIGSKGQAVSVCDDEESTAPEYLRFIDPRAGTVSVLDDELSLRDLYSAICEVAARAKGFLETLPP
jgi:hypothetical protein